MLICTAALALALATGCTTRTPGERALAGEITRGMAATQVHSVLGHGPPHRTTYSYGRGRVEYWHYPDATIRLQNGHVTGWAVHY
jgi:hypothetical protein